MDKTMNFEYFLPTRIVFGVGTVNKVGQTSLNLGKKAMIVTGSSTKKTGLLDEVISIWRKVESKVLCLIDFVPTPIITSTKARNCQQRKCDMVIVFGGAAQ
jgi:alcohol dehydrogenase